MQFSLLAVLSLGFAYQVYSSETKLKAAMQESGIFGDLWELPEFDSSLDSFGNNKYSTTNIDSEEECALECAQTKDCVAYTTQILCKPNPWSCNLIFKPDFSKTSNGLKRTTFFTRYYRPENEVQGAFYRPDTDTYNLVVGTLVVTYKTLGHLINGTQLYPMQTAGTKFPSFGQTVDDVLVRKVVENNSTYLLVHLILQDKCFTYRINSPVEPAVKVSEKQLEFPTAYGWADAAIELNQCQDCLNNYTRTTYFLIADKYTYEAPGDTWLYSADGGFTDNVIRHGSPFPGNLTAMTAALKYAGGDEELVLFEGLKFYYYHVTNKFLRPLGEIDLCP